MKEYKYTINGTKYVVAIGDIEENIANVTVNGEDYKVEMEIEAEPEKKKPVLGKPTTSPSPSEGGETVAEKLLSTRTMPSRLHCQVSSQTSRLPLATRFRWATPLLCSKP
jgi:hypothetical protein